MEGICGDVTPPGKYSVGLSACAPVPAALETLPATFQGQDVPRIVLNERRDLLFVSGICRWPRSALLSGVLPILGPGRRGHLSMDLSRFSTRCPAPVELRHC